MHRLPNPYQPEVNPLPKLRFHLLLFLLLPLISLAECDFRNQYPVLPWEDLWKELDDMTIGKTYCRVEKGFCWDNGTELRSTARPIHEQNLHVQCHCDDECLRYGDCCRDKVEADWGYGLEEGSSRYSCRKMDTTGIIGLLMVGTCSSNYEDKRVEALCLQQAPVSAYDYTLDMPVTSMDTNITYVNFYCAVCNLDSDNIYNWNATINCNTKEIAKEFNLTEFMAEAEYFPGKRQWQRLTYRDPEDKAHRVHERRYNCFLEITEFKNKTEFVETFGGRLCLYPKATSCDNRFIGRSPKCQEQVRHCHPDWPYHLDMEKCHRYSYLVTYKDEEGRTTYYKNPHCARCNFANVSSSDFDCYKPLRMGLPNGRRNGGGQPPVFSVLMDFRSKECRKEEEIWNPIDRKCQRIVCGKHFRLENGQCVRNVTGETVIDTCPRIPMEGYVLREDGSVVLNESKKTFTLEFYELVNDSHVLICVEEDVKFSSAHVHLTLVVLVVSIVCLFLHIVIYLLVPRFRNLPGKNLFSLACCLFVAQLLYLTGMRATYYHSLCVSIAGIVHFFWLASFCWMNIMSIDVCRTFTRHVYKGNQNSRKTYIYYSLYAWGIPALVVGLAFVFEYIDIAKDYRPEYGTDYCWMNNLNGVALFFFLPVGAIVLENVVLYFVTVCCIFKQAKAASYAGTRSQSIRESQASSGGSKTSNAQKQEGSAKAASQGHRLRKDKVRLMLYGKLGVIQGLSWILGLLASLANISSLWYPFTLFNGLQGAFIFMGFDLKRKVAESVWEALTGKPLKKHHQSSKTATNTSSLPASSFAHSRSSKSYSDSDGENQLENSVSHLAVGEGDRGPPFNNVAWQDQGKMCQRTLQQTAANSRNASVHQLNSTNAAEPSLGSHTMRKATGQQTAANSRNASVHQLNSTNAAEPSLGSHTMGKATGTSVRNGDLRSSIVKGRFDDERLEDFAALSRLRTQMIANEDQPNYGRKKSDIQRVIDLLQHLQQSKNSKDLHVKVQQLLAKNGFGTDGKQMKISGSISGPSGNDTVTSLHQEKKNFFAATKLKTPSQESDGRSAPTSGPSGPNRLLEEEVMTTSQLTAPSHRTCRPQSMMSVVPDDPMGGRHMPQQYSSVDKLHARSDTLRNVAAKTPKPQPFSNVSHVALAAAIMQKAAKNSRIKHRGFPDVDGAPHFETWQGYPDGNYRVENSFESLV